MDDLDEPPWTKSSNKLLEMINATAVTKDELREIASELKNLGPDRSWEASVVVIANRFCDSGSEKVIAIHFRLKALQLLLQDEGIAGWTLPAHPDGTIPIHEAVFAATATRPLVCGDDDQLVFNRSEFLECVFREAEPEGSA